MQENDKGSFRVLGAGSRGDRSELGLHGWGEQEAGVGRRCDERVRTIRGDY